MRIANLANLNTIWKNAARMEKTFSNEIFASALSLIAASMDLSERFASPNALTTDMPWMYSKTPVTSPTCAACLRGECFTPAFCVFAYIKREMISPTNIRIPTFHS